MLVLFEEGEKLVEFDGAVSAGVDLFDYGFYFLFGGVEGELFHDFLELLHGGKCTQGVIRPSPLTSSILKACLNYSVCSGLSLVVIQLLQNKIIRIINQDLYSRNSEPVLDFVWQGMAS